MIWDHTIKLGKVYDILGDQWGYDGKYWNILGDDGDLLGSSCDWGSGRA